jgi:IclR family acetate operon transcriptional repressor
MPRTRTPRTPPAAANEESSAAAETALRSGTLARGLAVLDVLLAAAQPMALGDLATQAALDLSTTLRLARALEDSGHVIRTADGKRYLPSPRALRPLPLLHPLEAMRREAGPIVRDLAQRVSQTAVLVVYVGMERLVVDVFQTPGSLSPYYSTWLHGPLHASGPGKALLLSLEPAQRRQFLGEAPYARHTEHTLVDEAALQRDLEAAAETGVVLVRDEYYQGLSAAAANFYGWNGRALGCIAITGHSAGFTPAALATITTELRTCTRLMPLQVSALRSVEQFSGR